MRTRIRSLAMAIVSVVAAMTAVTAPVAKAGPAPQAQAKWPQFQGNAAHTGVNKLETTLNTGNVSGLTLSWIGGIPGFLNFASPVVANGSVFITSDDSGLVVFPQDGCGAQTCDLVWRGETGGTAIATPAVVNGLVYLDSQASPTSNDGRLNVFDANGCGAVVCQPLWQGIGGKGDPFLVSSPAVVGGVVYVVSFGGTLFAFDAAGCGQTKCQPLWTAQVGSQVDSSPAVGGGFVFVASTTGTFAVFDAGGCGAPQCDPLWTAQLGGGVDIASPTVAGKRVFVGDGKFVNVFATAGCGQSVCQPLWRGKAPSTGNTPAVSNGIVYVDAQKNPPDKPFIGVVEAFDVNGCGQDICKPLWTGINFNAGGESSPVVANGVVYIGKGPASPSLVDSGVFSYDAGGCGRKNCKPLGFAQTGPQQFYVGSSPAVVDGQVYFGSSDSVTGLAGVYVFALPAH